MPAPTLRGVSPCTRDALLALRHRLPDPVIRAYVRGNRKTVVFHPSNKARSTIVCGTLQRDYLYLLEIDRAVTGIAAHPCCLGLVIGDRIHKYVPDFLLHKSDGTAWLIKVERDADAEQAENKALQNAAAKLCRDLNLGFDVVLESQIRRQPRLRNAGELLRYRGLVPSTDFRAKAMKLLANGPAPLGDLHRGSREAQAFGKSRALLCDGTIITDLDQPLSDSSLVSLPSEGDGE